jgi:MFS family permease
MTDFVRRFGQRHADGTYYFSNVRSGLIVALLSIGTLFGALVAAPIADKVGRRHSISFWSTIVCVGVIVQISSTDKWYHQVSQRSERPRTDMLTINRLRQRPVTFEAPSYQPINS